jgi:excinuclease UvrABC nuclease subunit
MMRSAEELRFEDAAKARDRLKELERLELER